MTKHEIKMIFDFRDETGCSIKRSHQYLIANNWKYDVAKEQWKQDTRESMKRFGGIMDG